jgi:hypothetical protein
MADVALGLRASFRGAMKNNFLKTHFGVLRISQTNKNKERNPK